MTKLEERIQTGDMKISKAGIIHVLQYSGLWESIKEIKVAA
jgi:hypothetical protein